MGRGRPDCTWCLGTGFSRSASGLCDCAKPKVAPFVPRPRVCTVCRVPSEHELCSACFERSLDRAAAEDRAFREGRAADRAEMARWNAGLMTPEETRASLPPNLRRCSVCPRFTVLADLCPTCIEARTAAIASDPAFRRQPGARPEREYHSRAPMPPPHRAPAPAPAIVRPGPPRILVREPVVVESRVVYDEDLVAANELAFRGHEGEQRRPYPRSGSRRAA